MIFQTKDLIDVFFNEGKFNAWPLYSCKKTRVRLDNLISTQPFFIQDALKFKNLINAARLNDDLIKLGAIKVHLNAHISNESRSVLNSVGKILKNRKVIK